MLFNYGKEYNKKPQSKDCGKKTYLQRTLKTEQKEDESEEKKECRKA